MGLLSLWHCEDYLLKGLRLGRSWHNDKGDHMPALPGTVPVSSYCPRVVLSRAPSLSKVSILDKLYGHHDNASHKQCWHSTSSQRVDRSKRSHAGFGLYSNIPPTSSLKRQLWEKIPPDLLVSVSSFAFLNCWQQSFLTVLCDSKCCLFSCYVPSSEFELQDVTLPNGFKLVGI